MRNTKVLIVDDEALLRATLCRGLTKAGFDVAEARDGIEALTQALAFGPEIAFLDIVMPRKEGLQAILELRRRFPRLKMIAMSGAGMLSAINVLDAATFLGANATLPKPFRISEAIAAARRLQGGLAAA